MPEVAVVISPGQSPPLPEFLTVLREELQRQGISSTSQAGFPEPRLGLVYLLISPREYVANLGESALPDPAILKRTVFLCAEDPEELAAGDIDLLRLGGAVFDISQGAVTKLHNLGISARLLRPGHIESWDRFGPGAPRPIDIMFHGSTTTGRTGVLAPAADVLSRHSCVVQLDNGPRGSSGPERRALLAQTKVLISIHRSHEPQLEWLRAVEAMHCGAVVVSEHSTGLAPFVPGEHLLVASSGALAHVAETVLRDEIRLARIRGAAHARLRDWLPFSASVSVLRAALIEILGRPALPGMFLGVARDGSGERSDESAGTPTESVTVRRELRAAREELADVRRQIVRLEEAVRSRSDGSAAPPVRLIHRNAAWLARRRARVSVLLVGGGDPAPMIRTLDTVRRSWMRDLEVIAVDGPGGTSCAGVRAWMQAHPRLAVTLVALGGDRGRGVARNVALDFARGSSVLIVEPGELLYPRCLGELVSALDGAPEASFVYPIQAMTGDATKFVRAGGDHLLSAAAWDPAWLRKGNPVQPPALIRTAELRGIGAYACDAALAGFEDYDLWCRMTAGGQTGRLVPQVLARRPAADALSELPARRPTDSVATAALVRRAPAVLADAFGAD